tara:strand:+ start:427 stop:639 length:213 start_codon:yes stop_codon:yes gene_type:complete
LENFQNEQFPPEDGLEGQQHPADMASMTPEQILWYQQHAQAEQYRQLAPVQQQAEHEGSQGSAGSQPDPM